MEGVVEVGIVEEQGIENLQVLNELGKDGEEEDLEFCRKVFGDSFTSDCL